MYIYENCVGGAESFIIEHWLNRTEQNGTERKLSIDKHLEIVPFQSFKKQKRQIINRILSG